MKCNLVFLLEQIVVEEITNDENEMYSLSKHREEIPGYNNEELTKQIFELWLFGKMTYQNLSRMFKMQRRYIGWHVAKGINLFRDTIPQGGKQETAMALFKKTNAIYKIAGVLKLHPDQVSTWYKEYQDRQKSYLEKGWLPGQQPRQSKDPTKDRRTSLSDLPSYKTLFNRE